MLVSRSFYVGLVLYTLAWLGYDHYRPWLNFHSESLAFASITLVFVGLLARSEHILAPTAVAVTSAAVTLLTVLQFTLGLVPFAGDALVSGIFIAGFFIAVVVGFTLCLQRPNLIIWLHMLMHAVWLSALLSAWIGILQWLNLQGWWGMYMVQTDLGDRASGNMGQPNQLATLLLMGLAAVVYLHSRKQMGKWALLAIVWVLSLALVLAQSRAGLMSAVLMVGFSCWKSRADLSKLSARWMLAWLGGILLATWLLPHIAQFLLIDSTRSMSVSGSELRVLMWKQMAAAIAQSPWVGYGWNHTPTAHSVGALVYEGSLTFNYAHNIILDILAWCGLPLGLLLVGLCSYWVLSRAVRVTSNLGVCAMAGLIPILMHSLVEYPFAYAYFLLSAGLLVGMVEYSIKPNSVLTLRKVPMWIAMVLWIPLAGYLVYEYLLIEEDFRVVRFQSLRIGTTPPEYEVPKIVMLTQLGTMLKAGRIRPEPNMQTEDIETLRKVSKRFAYSAINYRYAIALALNGRIDESKQELAVIRGMYGSYYYSTVIQEIREMRQTKYPVLGPLVD